MDFGVSCHLASGNIPRDSEWEICCDHSSAFNFELIFIIADKKDNYKKLNEFVFLQDPITFYGVTCP